MTWIAAFNWLVHSAVASTVLLGIGALVVLWCGQPADRIRQIQCSFVATLIAICLTCLPGVSLLSLHVLDFSETKSAPVELLSLPDGDYSLQIRLSSDSYDPPPLEQVFLRQNVSIIADTPLEELTIRAVPHVLIKGIYLNSAGEPRSGHEVMLFGRTDGNFYAEQSSVPGKDGKFEVKVPHGLQQVQLDLITNEHSAFRWRLSHDAPLRHGRRVNLGSVEDDIYGLEVVRYTAPSS